MSNLDIELLKAYVDSEKQLSRMIDLAAKLNEELEE